MTAETKTRKHITEKEIKIAAKNLKLQYGLAIMLINEIRSVQRVAAYEPKADQKCPECGTPGCMRNKADQGTIYRCHECGVFGGINLNHSNL